MLLNNKPFSLVEENDLLELISRQESEGKSLEFKRDLVGNSDSDKKEFLHDFSSFANASGGFIIYGIEENQGAASSLPGISGIDPDQEILRFENIIRTSIDPRIPGFSIRSISLSNGSNIVALFIPKSWSSPHMVTFKGTSRFYTRNSAGKYQMDVNEIRQAFLLSDNLSKRIRDFHIERLNKIHAGENPIPMSGGGKILLHLIPISAFESSYQVDLRQASEYYFKVVPYSTGYRYNLDGLLILQSIQNDQITSYMQLFRQGVVELVDDFMLNLNHDGISRIPSFSFESEIIQSIGRILQFQEQLGIESPIVLFLSLIDVKGYVMGVDPDIVFSSPTSQHLHKIDRDILDIPEIILENYSLDKLPRLIKPLFDTVWNASGWAESIYYDDSGNWVGKRR